MTPVAASQTAAPVLALFHEGGARERRVFPFTTGWRCLPFSVLEYSLDGCWQVESGRTQRVRVPPGRVIVIPAGVPHCLSLPEPGRMNTSWHHLSLRAQGDVELDLLRKFPRVAILSGARSRRVIRLLKAWDACVPASQDWMVTAVRRQRTGLALSLQILAQAREDGHAAADTPDLAVDRIRPVLQHLHDHYADRITRTSLARLAQVSPVRLHVLFKAATGQAPMSYLLGLRMKHARNLLLGGDVPVKEIAARCGFSSVAYFSRFFHKFWGASARSLRGHPPADRSASCQRKI